VLVAVGINDYKDSSDCVKKNLTNIVCYWWWKGSRPKWWLL